MHSLVTHPVQIVTASLVDTEDGIITTYIVKALRN